MGVSGPSLFIESTDSMIQLTKYSTLQLWFKQKLAGISLYVNTVFSESHSYSALCMHITFSLATLPWHRSSKMNRMKG